MSGRTGTKKPARERRANPVGVDPRKTRRQERATARRIAAAVLATKEDKSHG
jgi:hypothetical protein